MKWHYPSSSLSSTNPVWDFETAYLPLTGGEIVALRIKDGQLMWKTDVGGDVAIESSINKGSLYVANEVQDALGEGSKESGFFLRSLSSSSGVVRWLHELPQAAQHISNSNASMLFVVSLNSMIVSVDKKTGQVNWSSQQPSQIVSAPIYLNNSLYLALEDGEIVALRQEDGVPSIRYRTPGHVATALLAPDGSIYLGTAEGYVTALADAGDTFRIIWRRRVGTGIQSLRQTSQGLLVVSRDNSVTFLKRQNGKRLWKRHLPDRLAAQPLLQEDAGLFAPVGENVCIVLSLRDGKQVNTLYLGENNSLIATPLIAGDYLLVPTRLGLLAFTASG
jgi:outer membrane protein assembly factor BamB